MAHKAAQMAIKQMQSRKPEQTFLKYLKILDKISCFFAKMLDN